MADPEKPVSDPIRAALAADDPAQLAEHASSEQIQRMKDAEELMELRHQRTVRKSRWNITSQTLVGYVALAGIFINAVQNILNHQQWRREFDRAEMADTDRRFFEISILATDSLNVSKRLVGYALLDSFVSNDNYKDDATRMLEESLMIELTREGQEGEGVRQKAIETILTSLARTKDCYSLRRGAETIEKISQHRAKGGGEGEGAEILDMYVRRLMGSAMIPKDEGLRTRANTDTAPKCPSIKEFSKVREPLVAAIVKTPELIGGKGKLTVSEANEQLAQRLFTVCDDELSISGNPECKVIFQNYDKLCGEMTDAKMKKEEEKACALMKIAYDGWRNFKETADEDSQ